MIAFSLACYASVTGRMEEAKERLRHAIDLDKDMRKLAINDEDLRPFVGLDRRIGVASPPWSHQTALTHIRALCAGD
jgi:hypothetical protein